MTVLVDTRPLVALHDEHDNLHRRAIEELGRLRGPRLISLPVLTEATLLLDTPFHIKRLRASISRDVFRLGAPASWLLIIEQAFRWMERYSEHEPDFTDGFLLAWLDADRTTSIWTFDLEFTKIWRTPKGRRARLSIR